MSNVLLRYFDSSTFFSNLTRFFRQIKLEFTWIVAPKLILKISVARFARLKSMVNPGIGWNDGSTTMYLKECGKLCRERGRRKQVALDRTSCRLSRLCNFANFVPSFSFLNLILMQEQKMYRCTVGSDPYEITFELDSRRKNTFETIWCATNEWLMAGHLTYAPLTCNCHLYDFMDHPWDMITLSAKLLKMSYHAILRAND